MTIYAGEELQVTSTVSGFNGETLTDSNVLSVKIDIFDSASTLVVSSLDMTYDADNGFWYYLWDTTGLSPGTYKAKIVVQGLDSRFSWEWKRIRLAKDLVS